MDERIKLVVDYIEENLNSPLSLSELAAVACLSPYQFHRTFKRATQRTPFQFTEQMKMNRAYHRLMNEEPLKVRQLAAELGYRDYETFSRRFKKYFSLSPDDLKAILLKIKQQAQLSETEEIYVSTTIDLEDQKALLDWTTEILSDKNFTKADLQQGRIFKITIKPETEIPAEQLIKNKFACFEEKHIWKSLLKQLK